MKPDIKDILDYVSQRGSIIWTNGCFDVLHGGHIKMLEYCRFMADQFNGFVFVGLDSDSRIKLSKGENRPVNKLEDRKRQLLSLKYVDFVLPYDTDEELSFLVKSTNPALMVIGEEYNGKRVIGSEHGPEISYFPRLGGYSTTEIIERIQASSDD